MSHAHIAASAGTERTPLQQSEELSGESCGHCGKQNHFANVWQSKDKQHPTQMHPSSEVESAAFDSLCNATNSAPQPDQNTDAIQLDHHQYHSLSKCWVQKPSQPQPSVALTATANPDDYRALGFKPVTSQPRTAKLTAMADIGCQSCLAGMKVLHRLGLHESDLIPVTLRMHAANNNGIKILGAAILRFSGRSNSGQILETLDYAN